MMIIGFALFLGQIFNKNSTIGLNYQHGGYPPLFLHIRDGMFVVGARSDERLFIPKGGCGIPRTANCFDHPKQQVSVVK